MLILGRKYKFTKLEEIRLNKKNYDINILKYRTRDSQEVLKDIKEYLSNKSINTIVLNTKVKVDDEIIKYLTSLQFDKDISIITIEKFMEDYLQKCYIPDDHKDLHYLEDIKTFSTFQYLQKRLIDYIGVFTLLFLTWPILLIARFKIKKQSPGTSIFKQYRVGIKGKDFKCLKFRSMHLNSYHDPYTRENDTRIFPWGNTMRKTRIDELPQLLNVLRGDMHFIGPRAEWNILVKDYENKIPYYHERHLIRPGITGWAQVNYPYGANIEDTKQKLMYDLYYIKHWSILLEIKVVWKTIMVVLGKKGI
ncbi:MAG: sugar transferase [Campylobacterales bacterium]|nr:sugar transferase [Campylobacterales bacterium]